MMRAIELGKNALGKAAPNPMVGAVIVHQDRIIGEGFTSEYGGPHAEVNAIASVTNKSLLKEAKLYVTLEPCSHYGKTPPCSDLILKHQIPEVIIGLKDPHSKVAGRGIEKLEAAGVKVKVGVLARECSAHHKRFLRFQEQKRPYIILKWAESKDGFLAPLPEKRASQAAPYWITNSYSQQLVHQWRAQEQAILVGTNTALEDNPRLTSRSWSGKNPIRVVLDKNLRLPKSSHLFDGSVKTLVLTENSASKNANNLIFEKIDFEKAVTEIIRVVVKHEITSIIVEGGAKMLQSFITSNCWDEARIFKGTPLFGKGVAAPKIDGNIISTQQIKNDQLIVLEND